MKFVKYLVCVMMLVTCTACGKVSAESTAKDFMKALKKSDESILDIIYVDGNDSGSKFLNNLFSELGDSSAFGGFSNVLKEKLLDFEYDITSVKEEGDYALASVELTTENWAIILQDVATDFLPKVIAMAFDGKDSDDIEKEFKDFVKEEKKNTPDVTSSFELPLVKVGDDWKVDVSSITNIIQSALMGITQ